MKKCFWTIVLIIAAANGVSYSIDIGQMKQIFEATESSYMDISVNYDWYHNPPMTEEDVAGTNNLVQIGKSHKTFTTARPFEELSLSTEKVTLRSANGIQFDSNSSQSYNGKIGKYISTGGWPHSVIDGTITKRKDFMPKFKETPFAFTILRSYPNLLSKDLENKELCKLDPKIQKINDTNCVSIEFTSKQGFLYQRLYFSVDHGYAVVRFEHIKKDKVFATIDIFGFKKLSNGVWFPIKGVIKLADEKTVNICEVNDVVVNQGLKKEAFDIEFPPGTRVVDEILDTQYIVKPTEEQFDKWIEDEAIIAQYKKCPSSITPCQVKKCSDSNIVSSEEKRIEPNAGVLSQRRSLVAVLSGVIIIAVTVWYLMRRKK